MLIGLCGVRAPGIALRRAITVLAVAVFAVLSCAFVGASHAGAMPADPATSGNAAVAADSAPYPPSTPCTLSFRQSARPTSPGDDIAFATVVGSGLDSSAPVTVTYYSGDGAEADTIGSFRTDDDGAFSASVPVPATSDSASDSSWVTARTTRIGCKTPASTTGDGPPAPTGGDGLGGQAGQGGQGAGQAPPDTSTEAAPYPPGPITSPVPSGGTTAGPSPTPTSGAPATPPSGASVSPILPIGTGAGGTSGPGEGSSGGGAPGLGPTPTPTTPGATSPQPSSSSAVVSVGPQDWGLPTSFIVTMAVVLVLLGGVGVLVLTRRSG